MIADSPALDIHKYEVSGRVQINGGKPTVQLMVKKLDVTLVTIATTFELKQTKTSMEIEGTTDFNIINPQFKLSSKFAVQNKATKKGRQYLLKLDSVELGSLTGTFEHNAFEKMALIRTCLVNKKCNEINFSFNDNDATKKTSLTLMGKLSSQTDAPEHVFGLRASHSLEDYGFTQNVEVNVVFFSY